MKTIQYNVQLFSEFSYMFFSLDHRNNVYDEFINNVDKMTNEVLRAMPKRHFIENIDTEFGFDHVKIYITYDSSMILRVKRIREIVAEQIIMNTI